VGAYSGDEGDVVVEPHDESAVGRGHEGLYVVLSCSARFTVNGDDFDAASGHVVLVRPGVHRAARRAPPITRLD
jgi:mannose-6-phosphate isomerase-like protein (cupin superfamily)